MAGIDQLKAAVKLAVNLGEGVEAATADGKIEVAEVAQWVVDLIPIIQVIQERELLVEEIRDLDIDEIDELVEYAKEELNLENDNVEEVIEKVLDAIVIVVELVQLFKKDEEEPV